MQVNAAVQDIKDAYDIKVFATIFMGPLSDMPLAETGIASPFFFAHSIGFGESISLQKIENPWDRDVRLKMALGVPAAVFERAGKLIKDRDSE